MTDYAELRRLAEAAESRWVTVVQVPPSDLRSLLDERDRLREALAGVCRDWFDRALPCESMNEAMQAARAALAATEPRP